MEMLSTAVIQEIIKAAPHVRLCFAPKRDSDPDLLRDGFVDLEIGKRGPSALEVRTHFVFETSRWESPEVATHFLQAGR